MLRSRAVQNHARAHVVVVILGAALVDKGIEKLCAHSGMLFGMLLGLGFFGVTGWLPPPDPAYDANHISELLLGNRARIQIGVTLLAFGGVFWWTFSAAIAMQMRAIEGESHPLTYVQFASASGTVVAILLPAYIWLAMLYRPGVDPSTLQLANDLSLLLVISVWSPAFLQALAIGICILRDRSPTPLYPRWAGYGNLWVAISLLPSALLPFFRAGPFAWDGLIGFWLVAVIIFAWVFMMWWLTLRAIDTRAS